MPHSIEHFPGHHWLTSPWAEIPGLIPCGSPARCLERGVVESAGVKYVVETTPREKHDHRLEQGALLAHLATAGLRWVLPWLQPIGQDAYGVADNNTLWQLRKWADGTPLPRETYGNDAWRGKALAQCLSELHSASASLQQTHIHSFSLGEYIRRLMPLILASNPALHSDLTPLVEELTPFLQKESSLTQAFCHGDFHPGNVLWGDHQINAIIDWEFCGTKCALYDVANLLGCLGMDDPAFLTAPMAMEFVHALKPVLGTPDDWRLLPETIAALRFAWMREWWHTRNREMMIQELDFIWLILDNRQLLCERW